ncbi:MAG: fimbrillin family protein [Tidjanibacter sp.]|nr:fimbrillin family protein [Tidjanibacter sp.]
MRRLIVKIASIIVDLLLFGALAGCTRTETPVDALRGGEISLAATASTRAAETTTSTVASMGVSIYHTATFSWSSSASTATPNWVYNREVERSGSSWSYSPASYWPYAADHKLSFFAYSPYTTATNGLTLSQESAVGAPTLNVVVADDSANQVDLLVATPQTDLTRNHGTVAFTLNHAMTAIDFCAKVTALSDDYSLAVEQLTLRFLAESGNICREGTIDLATATWTLENGSGALFFTDPLTVDMPRSLTTLTTDNQIVTSDNGKLFMLPQTVANGAMMVDVTLRKSYSAAEGGTTEPVEFKNVRLPATTWQKGDSYAYVLTINLIDNSISATVIDWVDAGIDQSDQNYISVDSKLYTLGNTAQNDYAVGLSTNFAGTITTDVKDAFTGGSVDWLTDLNVDVANRRNTFDVPAQGATGRARRARVTLNAGAVSTSFDVLQSPNGNYGLEESASTIDYRGGSLTYNVMSRFEPYNGATNLPEEWTAETVDADGNTIPTPDWLTFTTSAAGSITATPFTATVAARPALSTLVANVLQFEAGTTNGTQASPYDLSSNGGQAVVETANCYIVNRPGYYCFPCNVMGNGDRGIIAGAGFTDYRGNQITSAAIDMSSGTWRAELLWQDSAQPVIENVVLSGDHIDFNTVDGQSIDQCNALIALQVSFDAGTTYTTVWSWHIWVTFWANNSFNDRVVSKSGILFDIMPVALGYKAEPSQIITYYPMRSVLVRFSQTNGLSQTVVFQQLATIKIPTTGTNLHYQWGRKDPLKCGTLAVTDPSDESTATIAYAIANPEKFISAQTDSGDWLATPNSYLWGNNDPDVTDDWIIKTIYDPSPRSYCLTIKTNYDNFVVSGSVPNASSDAGGQKWNSGYNFYLSGTSGETTFFNAHGYRAGADDSEENVIGRYWTMNVNPGGKSSSLLFDSTGVTVDSSTDRASALTIRPTIEMLYLEIEDKDSQDYDGSIWK